MRRKKIILLPVVLITASAAVIWGYSTLLSFAEGLPSTESLARYRPDVTTKIYDRNGVLIDELFWERRALVPLNQIPVDLQNAVLAIEDTNFFNHWGMDMGGVVRAFIRNIREGHIVQGGSTITQQLAKVMFLTPERTITRKIRELILAIHIEREYSKQEILQFYLNQIYFGEGAYGVEAAARVYFNKSVNELNLAESALLAGLPRAPNNYSPQKNIIRAYRRRSVVLRRMRDLGFITEEEEIRANSHRLPVRTYARETRPGSYFVEHIRRKLLPRFGAQKLYRGGLRIHTTLDMNMQIAAEKSIEAHLSSFDERKKREILKEKMEEKDIEDPDKIEISTSTFQEVQGTLVSIDPRSGHIRAMVGGRDFEKSEFNRATQARRQSGSAFKPFIFTAAIDEGYTPASILKDEPRVYYNDGRRWCLLENTTDYANLGISFDLIDEFEEEDEEDNDEEREETEEEKELRKRVQALERLKNRLWAPRNYYPTSRGEITLRTTLVNSINRSTVDLLDQIRPVTAKFYARKMGIRSRMPQSLSLALGSGELIPLEITAAYGVYANDGIRTEPYSITRVEDYAGNTIIENRTREKQVLSPQTNFIMVNLLKQACEYGTGIHTRRLNRPHGGKTGTTDNFSDAWFAGFTPNLVTTVWVGYDDRSSLGEGQAGGVLAAPIWTTYKQRALAHTPVIDFPVPDDIIFVNFDPDTGKLASEFAENSILQPFIRGTEPREYF